MTSMTGASAQEAWQRAAEGTAESRTPKEQVIFASEIVRLLRWWILIGEAERNDMRLRLKRWSKKLEALRAVKHKMEKAWAHKVRIQQTARFAQWLKWSSKEKYVKETVQKLTLKRALVYKWRVEFMKLCADLKRIKDRIRWIVDPRRAALSQGFELLQDPLKFSKLLARADKHLVKTSIRRYWLKHALANKALQAKIDRSRDVGAEHHARLKFWTRLDDIIKHARKKRRAATAFSMAVPRRAVNTWKAMLDHRHAGRMQLMVLVAKTGQHLEMMNGILLNAAPGIREDLLLQCDENGLTPLMWAAREGQRAAAELLLSYGGRLGNGANTRDLLTTTDNLGATAIHHAARSPSSGVPTYRNRTPL